MDKNRLEQLVDERLSIRKIANELQTSPTNVRYWLKKHSLKTNPIIVTRTKEEKRARHRDYVRNRYNNNTDFRNKQKQNVKKYKVKWKDKVRKIVGAWKAQGCAFKDCDEMEKISLTAHHLDESTKSFNIGDTISKHKSLKALDEELKKCICICHNCHAKVHAGIKHITESTVKTK
jgi:predicted transcriptional regulator